jgi:cell division protein FtsZ
MEGPLLEQGQVLARSQALLVSIVGGPDLAVQEVGEVMKAITTRASNDCRVFMGTVIDESARNKITITIVASEQWTLPEPSGGETAVAQTEILDAVQDEAPEKKKPARQKQTDLRLDFSGKGRFGNVEPTILEGEDWDIPTFIRRRITIEK